MINIDHIYIISLRSSEEHLWDKLKFHPYLFSEKTKVTIFNGINGWDLISNNKVSNIKYNLSKWWKIPSKNQVYNKDITPGEIGCGLSHYSCLQDAYYKGYNNVLILEEDFLITEPFPYNELFHNLPQEWSIIYLGRHNNWKGVNEIKQGKFLRRVGYSYSTQAILYSSKGIKEIINSTYLKNFIPWDEFLPSINGTTNRRDAINHFYNPNFLALGFDESYITQTSPWEGYSDTQQKFNTK